MHNFGLFYVAASLSFFGLLLIWSKQRAYGWVVISYLVVYGFWLLIWFANFQVQSQVGKPYSWIPAPTFVSFFRITGELIPTLSSRLEQLPALSLVPMVRVLLTVAIFSYIAVPALKRGYENLVNNDPLSFFLMAGYMVLATISIALIVSVGYKSIFLSRYLWPNHLLFLYQTVYAYQYFAGSLKGRFPSLLVKALPVYAVLITSLMFYQNKKVSIFPSGILSYLPALDSTHPVFFESADYFLPIWHYNMIHAFFLLDRPTAVLKDNLPNATNDYNVISSLHTKYGVKAAVPSAQFNRKNFPHFYVVDEQSRFQIEHFIRTGQVKIIRKIPVAIKGHQILECVF